MRVGVALVPESPEVVMVRVVALEGCVTAVTLALETVQAEFSFAAEEETFSEKVTRMVFTPVLWAVNVGLIPSLGVKGPEAAKVFPAKSFTPLTSATAGVALVDIADPSVNVTMLLETLTLETVLLATVKSVVATVPELRLSLNVTSIDVVVFVCAEFIVGADVSNVTPVTFELPVSTPAFVPLKPNVYTVPFTNVAAAEQLLVLVLSVKSIV